MIERSKLLALKLSALNESDFNWVHSRLANEVKEELDPYIREIKDIGFQVNQKDVDALMERKPVYEPIGNKSDTFQVINNADYYHIQKVFKSEHVVLFNTVVNESDWQWKNDKRFVDKTDLNGGIKVGNLASKKLLKASIINATAKALKANAATGNVQNNKVSQPASFILKIFGKLFRQNAQWKF